MPRTRARERAAGDRTGGSLLFFADFAFARPASRLVVPGLLS